MTDQWINARTIINALVPALAVSPSDDQYDAVVDALAEAAALIEVALQAILDTSVDDEQTSVL